MKPASKFITIIFLFSVVLLSACSQAAIPPAQILTPQETTPPQANNTSTSPSTSMPATASTSTMAPTPTTIAPQLATSIPTQGSGGSDAAYVAYASGLASNFTQGDICSLEQPFMLKGEAPPISEGLIAGFIPSSFTQGSYTFSNNILAGDCVDFSSGTYQVQFYTPSEGDIIMTGEASRTCAGVTTSYGTTEFRIAIRKAPPGVCP